MKCGQEGGLRIITGYSDFAQMGEMVNPFIDRKKKTLKEDLKGRLY